MKIPKVYFGAADRQMEPFIDLESFHDSLVYAILFQGDVVITDIFFYASSHISNLVKGRYKEFFLSALQCGAIIPSFRSSKNETFTENYKEILNEKIQTLLPNSESLVYIFQEAIDKTTRFTPYYWGNVSVGENFAKVVQSILLTDSEDRSNNDKFDKIWSDTYELKQRCLYSALNECSKNGWGLRRGEIYNSILKELGYSNKIGESSDFIITLDSTVPTTKNIRYLLKWVNYCYYFNQGKSFGLEPVLPKMDDADIVLENKFCHSLGNTTIGAEKSIELFSAELKVPSTSGILKISPEQLWNIRNGEEGALYFRALTDWQANPSEDRAMTLVEKLRSYTSALTNIYIKEKLDLFTIIKPYIPTSSGNSSNWTELLFKLAEFHISILGNLSFTGGLASSIYKLLPYNAKEFVNKNLGITKSLSLNVTDDKHSITNRLNYTTESRLTI